MSTMKKVLALTLALVMALSFASFGYTDEADITATNAEAVKLLSAVNVITGYTDDTFRPNGYITRAEAAKMIYVICNRGIDDKAAFYAGMTSQFTDVPAGIWYEGYVNYCASVGIIAGRTATTFDPQANVTGYELAKMLLVVAEYKPEVQGYGAGATDWQNCVYNDAYKAYMLQDVNTLMTQPINRQNAAKMMYNTLLNVGVAQYVGDLLISGTIIGSGSGFNMLTVGEKRMGLVIETGYVTAVNNVSLNGVTGTDTIVVDVNDDDEDLEFTWEADEALLGHQVKVVLKSDVRADGTGVDWNEKIYGVYGVYETGKTKVYNTTIDAITAAKNTTTNALTIKFEGYNNGNAKSHGVLDLSNNTGTNAVITAADDLAIYENDFVKEDLKAEYQGTGHDDAKLEAEDIIAYFSQNSAAPVVAVDKDGDGDLDHMFVTETYYGQVARNNGTSKFIANNIRLTTDGQQIKSNSITISKAADFAKYLNLIDDVKVGDVIAITPNYLSSALVYDIEKVAPTAVTAEDWTYFKTDVSGKLGEIETVKLNGAYYAEAEQSLKESVYGELNHIDETYYLHNGYVVFSSAAAITEVPANVAVVLGVSEEYKTVKDEFTGDTIYTFNVKYLAQDGKEYVRNYAVPGTKMNDKTIIGATDDYYGNTYVYAADNNTQIDGLRGWMRDKLPNDTLVEYVDDGTNVYFRVFTTINTTDYAVALPEGTEILRNAGGSLNSNKNVEFVKATNMLEIDGYDLEATEDTFFFILSDHDNKNTTDPTWKVVKASEFVAGFSGTNAAYATDVVMMADMTVPYGMLKMDKMPSLGEADLDLALLTGGYVITKVEDTTKHTVQLSAKDMAGNNMTLTVVLNAADGGQAGKFDVKGWVEEYTNKIVAYKTGTDGISTLDTVANYYNALTNHGDDDGVIGALNATSFRVDNDVMYLYNEDTVVVTTSLDANDDVVFDFGKGDDMLIAESSYVIYKTSTDKVETAIFVLVNLAYDNGTNPYSDFIKASVSQNAAY